MAENCRTAEKELRWYSSLVAPEMRYSTANRQTWLGARMAPIMPG